MCRAVKFVALAPLVLAACLVYIATGYLAVAEHEGSGYFYE